MNTEFELFPEAASTNAPLVDHLYLFMLAFSCVMTILVAFLVFYFAIKYRRGNNRVDRTQGHPSNRAELIWIALSVPFLMFIFVWGARVCFALVRPPQNAMPITVVAKQWMWKFQHPEGRREIDTLHVPVNQPVHLQMISQDVIHSFFVPVFRVKQDVLPGRYTNEWFQATKPGEYRLYCAEYCGTNHSRMYGRIIVQTPEDFADWLAGGSGKEEPPAVAGQKLFEQLQCATCHRPGASGAQQRGPSLEGVYQQPVALNNGKTVTADDAYLRESILRPTAKVVAGFQPIMPTFEGQVSEEGVLNLIAYIKSLGPHGETPKPTKNEQKDPGGRNAAGEPAAEAPAKAGHTNAAEKHQ
jgi:cytochrome c oxidase subunit 2